MSDFDVAVIGSGFGGSLLAMVARSHGRRVILLEKHSHPRFVIGESSTPLADLLWLDITRRHGLDSLVPFAKWGTWRRAHPEIACGLKRGFTFLHHRLGRPFAAAEDRSDQLMVAASARDDLADTHWYRPEFDQHLVSEAIRLGVEYRDHCEVNGVDLGSGMNRIHARRAGGADEVIRARFVVDASSHAGPLSRSLGLVDWTLPHLPPTRGLYTHFRGVRRLDGMACGSAMAGGPYPADDAAVHHVFDGGWIWVLRFSNGITSAGVSAKAAVADRLGLATGSAGWRRLLAELPTVAEQFADAQPVEPWMYAPRLSFQTTPAAGPGWALLPSAAGFVDPLLSSGFTLTLLGIERLSRLLGEGWGDEESFQAGLERHRVDTAAELLALERFIAALYARMGDFSGFTDVARLYFCAVILCETARRLGRPEMAGGFLMREHPVFGPASRAACAAATGGLYGGDLRRLVDVIIRDYDLGGLTDARRRPWYPVLADDLRTARRRVGADAGEIESLLRRAGMAEPELVAA